MTTLTEQMSADLAIFFDTDELADSVTLNGADVAANVLEQGREDERDFIEIEFRVSDYTAVSYSSDTFVINGETYRYPVQLRKDALTCVVRAVKGQRPRH